METNSEMYHPNQLTEMGTAGSGEENDFGTQSYQGYTVCR